MKEREKYMVPTIEVIEIENEGVMALSNMPEKPGPFSAGTNSARSNTSYNAGNELSEFGDLLNDILTIEK